MKRIKNTEIPVLLLSIIFSGSASFAEVSPDNSRVNEKDRESSEITSDQQSFNKKDSEITRRIRQALMKDESLSTYAHNIKIITINRRVTLKGPVRSAAEENAVLKYARSVAGESRVINEIAIVPEENS